MKALSSQRALLVGLGGLGCPAAMTLAAAGVGHLTLMDPDRVEEGNLHRQPLYGSSDVGLPKVEVAARRLRAWHPAMHVEAVVAVLSPSQAGELVARHDVTVDGTDDLSIKLALSDAAVRKRGSVVYGGALRMEGQAMVIAPDGPCLRCVFEAPPQRAQSCAQAGILGTVVGAVGATQGLMALAVLEGRAEPGVLLRFDGTTLRQRTLRVERWSECPACGKAMARPAA
jgi:molybdopterin/thiamine biosynthesis adenylyltransferase